MVFTKFLHKFYALLFICILCNNFCFAQDTRYATWDKFFLKPKLPLQALISDSNITLFIYHTYPSPLHNLKIKAKSDFFVVNVEPSIIKELNTTEIKDIIINIQRKSNNGKTFSVSDKTAIFLEFQATEIYNPKSTILIVPLTAKGEKEINEELAIAVGQMKVKVSNWKSKVYYIYIFFMFVLFGWFLYRKRKIGK